MVRRFLNSTGYNVTKSETICPETFCPGTFWPEFQMDLYVPLLCVLIPIESLECPEFPYRANWTTLHSATCPLLAFQSAFSRLIGQKITVRSLVRKHFEATAFGVGAYRSESVGSDTACERILLKRIAIFPGDFLCGLRRRGRMHLGKRMKKRDHYAVE